MKIVISNFQKADQFISIFEPLKLFTVSINIHLKPEGFYVQGMDNSHASMFEINLPSAFFDVYEFDAGSGAGFIVGVNVPIFHKILNTREKHQSIEMLFNAEKDEFEVTFRGEDKSEYNKQFEIPLLDLEEELLAVAKFDYQAQVAFNSKALSSLIDELSIFGSDTLSIHCDEELVQFQSRGIQGKMKVDIPMSDLSEFAIEEGGNINISYAIRFFHNICLFHKIAKECSLYIASDFPLRFCYFLCEPSEEDGEKEEDAEGEDDDEDAQKKRPYVQFFLAPKVDVNDD